MPPGKPSHTLHNWSSRNPAYRSFKITCFFSGLRLPDKHTNTHLKDCLESKKGKNQCRIIYRAFCPQLIFTKNLNLLNLLTLHLPPEFSIHLPSPIPTPTPLLQSHPNPTDLQVLLLKSDRQGCGPPMGQRGGHPRSEIPI